MTAYRLEAWSIPGTGPLTKLIGDIPAISADLSDVDDDYGYGTVEVPASWLWLDRAIHIDPNDHTQDRACMIVAYEDGAAVDEPAFEFIASFADRDIADDGTSVVRVHGPGITDRLNEAILYPYTDAFPDHVWGGKELLRNPNFEDGVVSAEFTLWHDGTGGSYTLDVHPDGFALDTTDPIAWNAEAATVAAAIQATDVLEARCTGSGTEESPYIITIIAPQAPTTIVVNTDSLTGGSIQQLEETVAGGLSGFEPWTKSLNPDRSGRIHGIHASDSPRLTEGAELVIEGEASLRVNGRSQFAGVQQTVAGVTPGAPLNAGLTVHTSDPDNLFRLVLRDLNEQMLDTTPETEVPINTQTRITLATTLTDTSAGVIWRFATTRPDHNPFPWIMDLCSLREGLPATTAGDMGIHFIDHAQDRGRLLWLEPTWTAALDSSGNAWDEDELELAFRRGMKYGNHVFAKLAAEGYEWHITRKPGAGPGDTVTHQIHLYNPGGRGTDQTTDPDGHAFTHGHITSGSAPSRHPRFTSLLAEAPGNIFHTATAPDLIDVFGTVEDYLPEPDVMTVEGLSRLTDTALDKETADLIGFRTTLIDQAVPVAIGDNTNWILPPYAAKHQRRISAIRRRLRIRDGERTWETEITASRVRSPKAAKDLALRRLLNEYKGMPPDFETDLPGGGGGGIPDRVISAGDTVYNGPADYFADSTSDQNEIVLAVGDLLSANERGWIHLLEGEYVIDGEIPWTGNGPLKITGAGKDTTTIRVANGANIGAVFRVGGGFNTAGDLILEDLTIDLNKGGTALVTDGIHISGGSQARLIATNVDVLNGSGNGINIQRPGGTGLSHLVNVRSMGHNGGGCIAYEGDATADACTFSNNGSFGFATGFGGARKLFACTINNNGADGIENAGLSGGTGDVTVIGCTVDGNTGQGIDLSHFNASPSVVVGNKVRNNGGQSITAHAGSVVAHNERSGNGTDETDPPSAGATRQVVTFSKLGQLAIEAGTFKFVLPNDAQLVGARAAVGDAPTGADVIVDINLNGTTIYGSDPRPTIADGTEVGSEATPTTTLAFTDDYLTVDIDQVGSTDPGEDLTVMVELLWNAE